MIVREGRKTGLDEHPPPFLGEEGSSLGAEPHLVTCARPGRALGVAIRSGGARGSSIPLTSEDFLHGAHRAIDRLGEMLMARERVLEDRKEAVAVRCLNP